MINTINLKINGLKPSKNIHSKINQKKKYSSLLQTIRRS